MHFNSRAEKEQYFEKVRNEGLYIPEKDKINHQVEIDMEIEEPGAAAKIAEEGAKTI